MIEIAKQTDYIDHNKIGLLGFSRGGMMAFLLSKESDDIQALVTVGAPTDMFLSNKNRPQLYNKVFLELIGDSINNRQEYIDRSPVYWADKLNEPILIIHGTDDSRVNIEHTKRLKEISLENKNKTSYLIVEGGNHSVSNYKEMRNDTIINWFNYHLN